MAKAVLSEQAAASTQNIYQLDGKVPLLKAIPFGLQHILAMFVANLTPITLIGAASGLDHAQIAVLLQNAMFVAGIATLIQLYPIWKIGSRLPVVMGVSFTFVTILSYVGTTYGYPTVMGAVLIGGLIEGTLGLLAKYWRKIITPVVAASVVTAIGYSLFTVGTRSFGGGYTENFGSPQNLLLGTITLVACLLFNIFAKGYWKQLSVLAGLIIGYLVALAMGMVDLSGIFAGGYLALPRLLPYFLSLTSVQSLRSPSSSWCPQQKPSAIPPRWCRVDWAEKSRPAKSAVRLPATVMPAPFRRCSAVLR